MSKNEFLDILGRSLKGKIDDDEYERQIDYYKSYFDNEMRLGRSESDILDELGDPRLIAKTIVSTYSRADNHGNETVFDETEEETEESLGQKLKRYSIFALAVIGILLIIAVAINFILILIPVIIVFIVVMFILKYFGNR